MVALDSQHELAVGDAAPDFELKGTDGETYSLSDFEDNEALLIVFTCNHCPYAVAKMPVLNDIAAEYDDVAVVGINPNDDEDYPDDSFEKMQEFVANGDVAYDAYLHDETQEVAKDYAAVCTPDPYLFRKDGDEFVLAYHGRVDDALNPEDEPTVPGGDIRDAIEAVLAGEEIEEEFKPSRGCSIKWTDGNEPEYWATV